MVYQTAIRFKNAYCDGYGQYAQRLMRALALAKGLPCLLLYMENKIMEKGASNQYHRISGPSPGALQNKKARFQAIPRELAKELKEWMLRTNGQLLFPGQKGGPLPNNTLNRAYRRLSEEAEVRPISSHGARHTSGSSYAVMGVGQRMIATLLGHSDVGTTARYTHIRVEATQPLVESRWENLKKGGE